MVMLFFIIFLEILFVLFADNLIQGGVAVSQLVSLKLCVCSTLLSFCS